MKEIWSEVWKKIKELCNNKFADIPPAFKELGINIFKAVCSFLNVVWVVITAIITGAISIIYSGLVATAKFLFAKWF